jgi:aspartyl-tRNA synthetase
VFALIEPLFVRLLGLVGKKVEAPFERLSYADAMLRYGSDKPDLRFAMPIADVSEEMATLGLEGFPALIGDGARARAIALPASTGISGTRLRKVNEDVWLGRIVGDAHASRRPLFVLKATEEAIGSLGKKGASETIARRLLEKAGARKDDTVLVGVDAEEPIAMAMGILRVEMARELKLVDESAFRFLWVTDFPLMAWDAPAKRYTSLHHPFTAPVDEDVAKLEQDTGKVRAKAYDLVLNGYEVGGGSIRIHDSGLQAKVFKLLSLSDEEARERFGFFLDALSYGTPPHGGIALGLDRMAMILAGEKSLREVIAFPKTASATDLMAGSPSPVRDEQLRELGLLALTK